MPTLHLNSNQTEKVALDAGSESWLRVVRNNTNKQRPCAIPQQYFDILYNWGYIQGTVSAAKISPTGLALLLAEESQAKDEKKSKKKKK